MSALARGIVLQKDGEQLVIQATESEVVQFAVGGQVQVAAKQGKARKPLASDPHWPTFGGLDSDGFLYNSEGKPVARVRSVHVDANVIDVTSFGDLGKQYVQGLPSYRIEAEGPVF